MAANIKNLAAQWGLNNIDKATIVDPQNNPRLQASGRCIRISLSEQVKSDYMSFFGRASNSSRRSSMQTLRYTACSAETESAPGISRS